MGFQKAFLFKSVVVMVILAFLAQDIAFANPSPGFFQQAVLQSFNRGIENPMIHGQPLQLQKNSGQIIRIFQGKSSAPVFLIQDAHYHLEAQQNAAAAMIQLINKYDIGTIGIEGAAGELWHDWATRYPDQIARQKVFQFWLNGHDIGAAEYSAAQVKKPMRIFGLENSNLYARHLQVDRLIRSRREKMQTNLRLWCRALRGLLSQVMPPAYLEYVAQVSSQTEDPMTWIKKVLIFSKKQNVDLSPYPQVVGYAVLEEGIEKLNNVILMREFRRIQDVDLRVGILQLTLKSKPTTVLDVQTKMIQRGYTESFPNLMQWLNLLSLTSRLDENLLREFQALDRGLRRGFLKNAEQIWLEDLSSWTDLLEKWQKLEWTPEDAALYERDHGKFLNPATFLKISELASCYRVETNGNVWKNIFESSTWSPWFEFYALALKRDQTLAVNTEKILKTAGSKPVLIYTGGFHTPGLERDLRRRLISFVTIRPVIQREQETAEKIAYEKALDGRGGFFEKILKQSLSSAARAKRIPFELVPPRPFPVLTFSGVPQSGLQAAFLEGGTTFLAGASAVTGSKPVSFQGLTEASRMRWKNVEIQNQTETNVTITSDSGAGNFRWKKGLPSGTWKLLSDGVVFQLTGSLKKVEPPSAPEFSPANAANSFGELLSLELAPKKVEPVVILKAPVAEIKKENRAELRRPNSKPSLSKAILILFAVVLGPIGAFAKSVQHHFSFDLEGASPSALKEIVAQKDEFKKISQKNFGVGSADYGVTVRVKGKVVDVNLDSQHGTPITKLQEKLLAPGSPFAIAFQGVTTTATGIYGPVTEGVTQWIETHRAEIDAKIAAPVIPVKPVLAVPATTTSPTTTEPAQPQAPSSNSESLQTVSNWVNGVMGEAQTVTTNLLQDAKAKLSSASQAVTTFASEVKTQAQKKTVATEVKEEDAAKDQDKDKDIKTEAPWYSWERVQMWPANTINFFRNLWNDHPGAWIKAVDHEMMQSEFLSQYPRLQYALMKTWTLFGGAVFFSIILAAKLKRKNAAALKAAGPHAKFFKRFPSLEKAEKMLPQQVDRLAAQLTEYAKANYSLAFTKLQLHGKPVLEYALELDRMAKNKQEREPLTKTSWKLAVVEGLATLIIGSLFFLGYSSPVSPIILVGIALGIRWGWTGKFFIAEQGHTWTSLFVGSPSITLHNLLGWHTFRTWILSLIPFMPLVSVAGTYFPSAGLWQMRVIRWAGWLAGTVAGGFVLVKLMPEVLDWNWLSLSDLWNHTQNFFSNWSRPNYGWFNVQALAIAAVVVVGANFVADFIRKTKPQVAHCGNASCGGRADAKNDLEFYLKSFAESLMITEVRGKISVGFVAILESVETGEKRMLHKKYLIEKRMEAQDAFWDFAEYVRAAATEMGYPLNVRIAAHLRYPTSGIKEGEQFAEKITDGAHPHVWMFEGDRKNAVGHNGDSNHVQHKGKVYSNDQMRWTLARVLKKNVFTTGDSPVVAGWQDLVLVAQGEGEERALAAVRYGHFEGVVDEFEEYFGGQPVPENWDAAKALPDTSLTVEEENTLAQFLQKNLEKHAAVMGANLYDGSITDDQIAQLIGRIELEDPKNLYIEKLFSKWGAKKHDFITTAVTSYFRNDFAETWKIIMERFIGTAGIAAYSVQSASDQVGVAFGQPLVLGVGKDGNRLLFGFFSERNAARVAGYERILDLDNLGEIVHASHDGENIYISAYSMTRGEISKSEIEERLKSANPLEMLSEAERHDTNGAELRRIPQYLHTTREEWAGRPTPEVPIQHNPGVASEAVTVVFRDLIAKDMAHQVRSRLNQNYVESRFSDWLDEQSAPFTKPGQAERNAFVRQFLAETLTRYMLNLVDDPRFIDAAKEVAMPKAAGLELGKILQGNGVQEIRLAAQELLHDLMVGERFPRFTSKSQHQAATALQASREQLQAHFDCIFAFEQPHDRVIAKDDFLSENLPEVIPPKPYPVILFLIGKEKNEGILMNTLLVLKKLLPDDLLQIIFKEPNQLLEEAERFTRSSDNAAERLEHMDVPGLRERLGISSPYTLGLLSSESGQTFSSAFGSDLLVRILPEYFNMTVNPDSPAARAAGFSRTFILRSGWSPSEVHLAASAVLQLNMMEFVLYLAKAFAERFPEQKLTRAYQAENIAALERLRDSFLSSSVANITGYTLQGKLATEDAPEYKALVDSGKSKGNRINEPLDVWVLSTLYIMATVSFHVFGLGIPTLFAFISTKLLALAALMGLSPILFFACAAVGILGGAFAAMKILSMRPKYAEYAKTWTPLKILVSRGMVVVALGLTLFAPPLMDGLFYVFLSPILPLARRWVMKLIDKNPRTPLDRIGFKKIVIVSKYPHIAKMAEIAVRKMFSQSFGINGIQVYGTDNYRVLDEHSGDRSTWVILLGEDGRIPDLANAEQSLQMVGKQIKTILSTPFIWWARLHNMPYAGAHITYIGTNPHPSPKAIHEQLLLDPDTHGPGQIPQQRIVQELFGQQIESMKQWLAVSTYFHAMVRQVSAPSKWAFWRKPASFPDHRTHAGTGVQTTAAGWAADVLLPFLQKMLPVLRPIPVKHKTEQLPLPDYVRVVKAADKRQPVKLKSVQPPEPEVLTPPPARDVTITAPPVRLTGATVGKTGDRADAILELQLRALEDEGRSHFENGDFETFMTRLRAEAPRFARDKILRARFADFLMDREAALQTHNKQHGHRAELRVNPLRNLSSALGGAAELQSQITVGREERRLAGLLEKLGGASLMLAMSTGVVSAKQVVVLSNPSDSALVRGVAQTGKLVILQFDSANSVTIQKMRAEVRGIPRIVFALMSLSALQKSYGWESREIIQIQSSAAVEKLPQANAVVTDVLGAARQRVVVFGGNTHLAGVRQESILDVFEELMLSVTRFATSV